MHKILLDGKEANSLVLESLPMLIHGQEGSGASLYTICLAAKWFEQNYKILFLCGYPMAEETFSKEVGINHPNAYFFTKEKTKNFIGAVNKKDDKTIVVIKNIELFEKDIFDLIKNSHNFIVSGDVNQSQIKDDLLKKKFSTEVYFSPFKGKDLPAIAKYNGYVISDNYTGITSLQ